MEKEMEMNFCVDCKFRKRKQVEYQYHDKEHPQPNIFNENCENEKLFHPVSKTIQSCYDVRKTDEPCKYYESI